MDEMTPVAQYSHFSKQHGHVWLTLWGKPIAPGTKVYFAVPSALDAVWTCDKCGWLNAYICKGCGEGNIVAVAPDHVQQVTGRREEQDETDTPPDHDCGEDTCVCDPND